MPTTLKAQSKRRPGDYARTSALRQLKRVYKRYNGVCQLCDKKVSREDATREHIVDLWRGGDRGDDNCVLACKDCNQLLAQVFRPDPRHHEPQLVNLILSAIRSCLARQAAGGHAVRTGRQSSIWGEYSDL